MARPSAQVRDRIWSVYNDQFKANLLPLSGAGAPTDGESGTGAGARGQGGVGCLYHDTTNGEIYVNRGTHASPAWVVAGSSY